MRTSNGVWVPSRRTSHAINDSPQVKKVNLQIIPFNTNDRLFGREEDYLDVSDNYIVNFMKEKTLKGGKDNEHMISFKPSSLQSESHMELAMMEKDERSTTVTSMDDGRMDGL